MCKKPTKVIHEHHLIPKWFGILESDTLNICVPCHRRLESYFDRFIKWGSFHVRKSRYNNIDTESKKRWRREYYSKNRLKRIAYQKEYATRNRDRVRRLSKEHRIRYKEKINEYQRAYYQFSLYGNRTLLIEYEKKYGKVKHHKHEQAYFDLWEVTEYAKEDCYPLIPKVTKHA